MEIGKCYKIIDVFEHWIWIFKVGDIKYGSYYSNGWFLHTRKDYTDNKYHVYQKDSSFYTATQHKYVIEEIDFSLIIDLLPNDNQDKIIYLRNKKIETLLHEN